MACRRPGDKPLSEPMMSALPTHICVTRPLWVNTSALLKMTHIFMTRYFVNMKSITLYFGYILIFRVYSSFVSHGWSASIWDRHQVFISRYCMALITQRIINNDTGKQFCDTVLSGSIQPNVVVSWLVDMTRLLAIVHETFSCLSGNVRKQLYKDVLNDKKIMSGATKIYLYWDFSSCRFMLPFVLPNNDHSPPVLSRLEKGSIISVGPKRSGIKSLL